ncbi:MAG: DUF1697 domain-containing protein [Acidimicrobiales bacterium]
MTRYAVLLRGINVGGHNKLPMADLRAALEGAGYEAVETYIQSGNVALNATSCRPDHITAVIQEEFGLDIPVVVRTARQLRAAIKANPFPETEAEPKRLLVYFCSAKVPKAALKTFDHERYLPDRMAAGPAEIYVSYDVGLSQSKLSNVVLDRVLGLSTTARNWTTVLKLADMVAG